MVMLQQAKRASAGTLKTITLSSGVTLPYVEQGDPDGMPLVLLHGMSDSWRSFECILPYLPASLHTIALTQRGHGDADRPEDGYHLQDFAADLAEVVAALDLSPAIIVGHSMGSFVAQRFAIDHPEQTRALVLIGSATSVHSNPEALAYLNSALGDLHGAVDPAFVREFQTSPGVPADLLEIVIEESLKVPARVWRETWRGLLTMDTAAELAAVQAPTLIVWGEEDALLPRSEQALLAAGIANSRLLIYPGLGHNLHWEEPQRVAADLLAFITAVAG